MKPTTPGARVEAVLRGFPGKGTAKLVMIGIATHDGEGGAWPSVDTLASYASVTRRNVQRSISDLEADGWITVAVNQGGARETPGDRRPNLYEVDYDRLLTLIDEAALVTPRPDHGAARAPSRGGACDTNGAARAPREGDKNRKEQDPGVGEVRDLFGERPAEEDPNTSLARRIADAVFKNKRPKPAGRNAYLGVRSVALALLEAGHEPRQIHGAMMAASTISIRAIEVQIGRDYPSAEQTERIVEER